MLKLTRTKENEENNLTISRIPNNEENYLTYSDLLNMFERWFGYEITGKQRFIFCAHSNSYCESEELEKRSRTKIDNNT